jgi:hypothetical protein
VKVQAFYKVGNVLIELGVYKSEEKAFKALDEKKKEVCLSEWDKKVFDDECYIMYDFDWSAK